MHRFLHHLHERLRGLAPRPVGITDDATSGEVEVLTFLPGQAGADCWPAQASENGLVSAARLLRTVHEASRDYLPEPDARWGAQPQAPAEVICHGDSGPRNMTWRDGEAVGLFDWDFAHPGPALDDVAYALEYLTPFRSDEQALRWHGFTSSPKRRRRLELFVRAYGWAEPLDVPALIESVIARQRATINAEVEDHLVLLQPRSRPSSPDSRDRPRPPPSVDARPLIVGTDIACALRWGPGSRPAGQGAPGPAHSSTRS